MKTIIAIFTLFHLAISQNVSSLLQSSSVQTGNGNEFIDKLLTVTKLAYGHQLDPHPLPDMGLNFEKRFILITYRGKAQLHDGVLSGLTSMHRDDDCTMQYNSDGFHINVPLGLGVLHFDYKGTISFMNVGPTIEIYGSVGYVSVEMEIEAKTGSEPELKEFRIIDMKGVEIKVRNRLLLNSIVKIISKMVLKLFNPQIKKIIEKEVRGMLAEKLKTLKLPM
ncbi:mite allergen Lep d 7-like [Centruroides vittatus]|uniref:mite allergen Lep d 7-like n=1 Tax=Centruroides vittatus TaxID=120091 RepID=UPI00350FE176